MFRKNYLLFCGILFFISGCSNVKNLEITPENNIINRESALQIRDIQVRNFENTTKEALLNAVVDTLLDDGYFITTIDVTTGVVGAKNTKQNLELNLMTKIKEIKNNNYSVRFSINAIDRSLAFKSYIIITDDKIYRYLFDRLRKSLFLDKEFYGFKEKEPEKLEIHEVKNESINMHKEDTISIIDENLNKEYTNLVYSVQFMTLLDKKVAQKEFIKLKEIDSRVRIHKYKQYQVIRLGRFKTKEEAELIMDKYKNNYPDIIIVKFKSNKL